MNEKSILEQETVKNLESHGFKLVRSYTDEESWELSDIFNGRDYVGNVEIIIGRNQKINTTYKLFDIVYHQGFKEGIKYKTAEIKRALNI